jgi:hypothetical protein
MVRFLSFLLLLLPLYTIAQESVEDIIIGDWQQEASPNDPITIHFDADRSMYIETKQGTLGKGKIKLQNGDSVEMLMRYKITESETNKNIDFIYAVGNYFNTVGLGQGIMEVLTPNLVRLAMNQDKPKPNRPTNFNNASETKILKRVGSTLEVNGCEKFHTGKFKIEDAHSGTTIVTRDVGQQIEENIDGNYKVKLEVNWIDNCVYTLKLIEYIEGESWIPKIDEVVLTTRIIHTTENSYIQTTSINDSDIVRIGEILKIE